MRRSTSFAIVLTCSVIASVLLSNMFLFASESSSQKITIVATVQPLRSIVVDNNFTIQKIYSNTSQDVRPVVLENALDGSEIGYTNAIRDQYEQLKPSLNFAQPGLVYERDNRPIQALIKRVAGFITHLFSFL